MQTFDHRKYRAPAPMAMPNRQWPNRQITRAPIWASVDLRDGNQALLEPMSVEQKKRMWQQLVKMGFKEIEVGFPSASQTEYDFVRWLIEARQIPEDVSVQVLVQAREDLIKRTFESLQGVHKAIVHVYNSTSTIQRERVFQKSRDEITAIAVKGAQWLQQEAARYPETQWQFQYSPESFTQTEMDYAVEVCNAVIDTWQPTADNKCIINLPATVEVTTPNVFADQVEYFATHVSQRDSIIISVHTHNDRGSAVAAGELALLAGADRVEGTLLGNGERTGNMDILTMAMNLYSQGIDPQLDISNPDEIIQVYSECTQLPVHPRHPWIGELVYTAFSGSHQDAIRKSLHSQDEKEPWQVAYLPIDPRDIGRDYQAVIRVNSQSGKGGIAFVLERDYGLKLPRWMQIELAQVVQKASEDAGEINSEQIYKLFRQHFMPMQAPLALSGYHLNRNGHDVIEVKVEHDGQSQQWHGEGDGALAAFIYAAEQALHQQINVVDYEEHAMGEGTDAEAVCYIQMNIDGQRIAAAAQDRDTVSASLKAVIAALNRDRQLQAIAA
jgi:2-isopropylmalate synthase